MPSYAELSREAVWVRQFTPSAMNERLLIPLRNRYGLGPASIGAAGDNNHLYGRHRSRNWCLQSVYCTNRSYGTTHPKDQGGNGDWYRAVDIGITGQPLYDTCRRVDTAVRAGRLPGLAEWFGTFDGKTVVGWYQGRPSSSDSSHLWHFHGGWWNESANDAAGYDLFYRIFTGTGDDMTPEENQILRATDNRVRNALLEGKDTMDDTPGYGPNQAVWIVGAIKQLQADVAQIKANQGTGGVDVEALAAALAPLLPAPASAEQIADAVVDEEHSRLAE